MRSAYDQRFFYDSSTPADSPPPSDEYWSDYDNDEAPPDFGDDFW